jgi:hypothetical protein
MLTISGGIILAIVILFAFVVLISVPFAIWDRITTRKPKRGRKDCPICNGLGQQEMMGGNMKFHIACPSCFPPKR